MLKWRATVSANGQDTNVKSVEFTTMGLESAEKLSELSKLAAARQNIDGQFVWRIDKLGEVEAEIVPQPAPVVAPANPKVETPNTSATPLIPPPSDLQRLYIMLEALNDKAAGTYQVLLNVKSKLDVLEKRLDEKG